MFHWEWTVFGYLFYNFPFFGFHSAISYLLFDLQNQSLIDDVIALNFGKLLMLVFVCFCWIFNELSGKYLKKMYAYRLYANITYTHTHARPYTYIYMFVSYSSVHFRVLAPNTSAKPIGVINSVLLFAFVFRSFAGSAFNILGHFDSFQFLFSPNVMNPYFQKSSEMHQIRR